MSVEVASAATNQPDRRDQGSSLLRAIPELGQQRADARQRRLVVIAAPTGPGGVQATATATVRPKNPVTGVVGGIGAITVTDPGSGYATPPVVTIESPGVPTATGATATAVISSGAISSIAVDATGFGYTAPVVTITPDATLGVGSGATARASGGVDDAVAAGGVFTIQPIVVFSPPDPLVLPAGVTATDSRRSSNAPRHDSSHVRGHWRLR